MSGVRIFSVVQNKGKSDFDEETQKILDSFKNAQIVKKPRRKRTTTPLKSTKKAQKPQDIDRQKTETSVKPSTSPYVKLIKLKMTIPSVGSGATNSKTVDYSAYVVKSAATAEKDSLSEPSTQIGGLDMALSKSYKLLVPRDRPAPMKTPLLVARCAFCGNYANFDSGFGDLFGPYRISEDCDFDLVDDDFEKGGFN